MKGLSKFFIILLLFNFIVGIGITGFITVSIVGPSFKGTGLSFTDLFKSDIEPEKYNLLKENLTARSSMLGKQTGDKIVSVLDKILPKPNFDYSKIPAAPYPYPEPSEIVDMTNEIAEEAAKKSIESLEQFEKELDAVKEKALSQ